jgi:mono/diheme cytochrome c family protein
MKTWLAFLSAIGVAAIAMSEAIGDAPPAQPAREPLPVRGDARIGEALAKRWCNECHLLGGAKTATDAAPTFVSIGRDPSKGPNRLRAFLSKPHAPMPPIPLSGTEVEDLIAYIQKVGGR